MARGINMSDWETEDRLAELRALSGHTLVQIAGHIGVSESTLKRWCKKSEAIRDALKQYDKQRRIAVENAIYDACFTRKVKTVIKKQVLDRDGVVHDLIEEKVTVIPADVRAQQYWLKNRDPDRWKDVPKPAEDDTGRVIVGFVPVPERMGVPEEDGEHE